MTLQETRARSAAAAIDVAERLRANARNPRPLPYSQRREVFELIRSGMPQLASIALDGYLAEQEAAHV